MVVIRLTRSGTNKTPFYHLVVTDRRNPRDGSFIEQVGYFNPGAKGNAIRLQMDAQRIEHWVSKGAQPSDRVADLIVEHKTGVRPVKKAKKKAAPETAEGTSAAAEGAAE